MLSARIYSCAALVVQSGSAINSLASDALRLIKMTGSAMWMHSFSAGTLYFWLSRIRFNSLCPILVTIFMILTTARMSFAGTSSGPDAGKPKLEPDSGQVLANRVAESGCNQSPASASASAVSKSAADREDEDDDDDDPPAASPSLQRGVGSMKRVNDVSSGKTNTVASEAQTGSSDDEDDDDDDAQPSAGCGRSADKKTAVSKATAADDDDDEDDDDDDEYSVAKPVKVSDIEPVPGIQNHFDFYRDTDGNVTLSSGSIATSLVGDTLVQMRREGLMAHDPLGTERVESTLLSATQKTSKGLALTAGLGTVRTLSWQSAVGGVSATQAMGDLSVTLSAAREMVGGTAQAIRERIMRTDLGFYLYNDFTDHISGEASFHHDIYNDGNRSDQAVLSPQYEILLTRSQLAFGYSLTYLSFAQSVDRGYHDPRRLLSNDLTATWKFDRGEFYGNFEASGGRVLVAGAASGQGANGSGFGESSVATVGLRITEAARMETYWSNELYPGWNSSGFGFRIWYDF